MGLLGPWVIVSAIFLEDTLPEVNNLRCSEEEPGPLCSVQSLSCVRLFATP